MTKRSEACEFTFALCRTAKASCCPIRQLAMVVWSCGHSENGQSTVSGAPTPDPSSWPGHSGNWGRWNNDLGTLNLITPSAVQRGISSVRTGQVICLSRPVTGREPIRAEPCFEQTMLAAGVWDLEPDRPESLNASESVRYRTHGMVNTHMDALSHVGFKGTGFNGVPYEKMATMEGVHRAPISNALGIVTRGILIDIVRRRNVAYLEPGDFATPDDIPTEAIEPGDAVIIRLGGTLAGGEPPTATSNKHGRWPGLHPDCVEVLAACDPAVVCTDTSADVYPSPYSNVCRSPVHTLALTFYGVHLIHNADLESLSARCDEMGRTTFLFMVSPLHLTQATGSLVSPLAVL